MRVGSSEDLLRKWWQYWPTRLHAGLRWYYEGERGKVDEAGVAEDRRGLTAQAQPANETEHDGE